MPAPPSPTPHASSEPRDVPLSSGIAGLGGGLAAVLLAAVCVQDAHARGALAEHAVLLLTLSVAAAVGAGYACRHFVHLARRRAAAVAAPARARLTGTALLQSLLALLGALMAVQLLLPLADGLLGTTLTRTYLRSAVLLLPAAIALATGLRAGLPRLYPAPAEARQASFSLTFPRGLVLFPFAVSLFLIVALLFAARQMGAAADDPCGSKVVPSTLLEMAPPRDFPAYRQRYEQRRPRLRGMAAPAPPPRVVCPCDPPTAPQLRAG